MPHKAGRSCCIGGTLTTSLTLASSGMVAGGLPTKEASSFPTQPIGLKSPAFPVKLMMKTIGDSQAYERPQALHL